MVVVESTLILLADIPTIFTSVIPLKFFPVMVIVVPLPARVGVKETIVGRKRKPFITAVPPGVTIFKGPELPFDKTALIVVADTTEKEDAETPPKLTAEALVKSEPMIATVLSSCAVEGEKDCITDGDIKKNPLRESEPYVVVTDTLPDAPLAV